MKNKKPIFWEGFPVIPVLTYYLIAVGISMFFRVHTLNPEWYSNLVNYRFGWIPVSLLRASGPLAGGVICIWLFRKQYRRRISLFGTSGLISMVYLLAPVLMITIMGVSGNSVENPHLFGLLSGMSMMAYCFFEETGWRGFLFDVLRRFSNPYRFIIIGILWYLWHLNFIGANQTSIEFGLLVHLPSCIIGSWIIGALADKYKSLFVAAAVHSMFNVFFDLQTDLRSKFIIAGGMLLIWMLSSYFIDKKLQATKYMLIQQLPD